ncbi:ATP-binding protein [Bacillus sp. 1NLA3E]
MIGHKHAKQAIEIAAAGEHHLFRLWYIIKLKYF